MGYYGLVITGVGVAPIAFNTSSRDGGGVSVLGKVAYRIVVVMNGIELEDALVGKKAVPASLPSPIAGSGLKATRGMNHPPANYGHSRM